MSVASLIVLAQEFPARKDPVFQIQNLQHKTRRLPNLVKRIADFTIVPAIEVFLGTGQLGIAIKLAS